MRAAEMNCIKMADAYENEAFSKQALFSLINVNSIGFPPLHQLVADTRPVMIWMSQGADGVGHTLALLDAALYTPPQVDEYEYTHVRRETGTDAVERLRWRTLSFLVVSSLLAISPSKKSIMLPLRSLPASYCKVSLRLFSWVIAEYIDLNEYTYFILNSTCISSLTFDDQISLLLNNGLSDIQMYSSPLNRIESIGDRRITDRTMFTLSARLMSEGDRKKDGKPLKPVKPVKPKTRKQKPGREGDKEKQEENEPRTEGPVLWMMQKGRDCISS